jgi:hypothetical protein
VPEAEELVPEALPEREEDLIETAVVVRSAHRSAAFAAAEGYSAVDSVVPKERFVRMTEAAARSAVDWAAEKARSKARFEAVVVRSAHRSAAIAAAKDSVADSAVPKERFVRIQEAGPQLAVDWAAATAWPEAVFQAVVAGAAGRSAATAAREASALEESSAAGSAVARVHFVRMKAG